MFIGGDSKEGDYAEQEFYDKAEITLKKIDFTRRVWKPAYSDAGNKITHCTPENHAEGFVNEEQTEER